LTTLIKKINNKILFLNQELIIMFLKNKSIVVYTFITLLSITGSFSYAAENWASESELGLVVNQGNAESQSVSVKNLSSYKLTEKDTFTFKGEYFQSEGVVGGVNQLTSENALAEVKYERMISEMFGAFATTSWSKNNFRGFEDRFEFGPGLSYYFLKSDNQNLFTEHGYLFRQETAYLPGPPSGDRNSISFYRAYVEGNAKISPTLSGRLWVESKLNVENTEDVEVRIEPSLSVMVYGNLSLGLAYRYNFDNVPPEAGLLRVDTTYMTTLKAKF
jgi:putative salt-induced outer membrane protein YdiY